MTRALGDLLLIGGGHAHVAVLADWIEHGLPCERTILVTPSRYLRYSGMVPGWIAGQYERDEGLVDVGALAERAGAELVLDSCIAINPDDRSIETAKGQTIRFDIASIDTGGVGRASSSLGNHGRLVDVRPIGVFVDRLAELPMMRSIAVVGGGAGGCELAFALRNRASFDAVPSITFVCGSDGLLPGFSAGVRARVRAELKRQDITVIEEDARIENENLMVKERSLDGQDLIVAAIGSGAPEWPRSGGLACDEAGFIAVDCYQRSTSHPHILAVGDVAARQDVAVAHSGVHAVMAGPLVAANLRKMIRGEEPYRIYRPRPASLYLLSTANGSAIASYGPLSAQGRWVARLKHWIDKRWISKYASLAHRV